MRRFVAWRCLRLVLLGALFCSPAHAQSEFIGQTFPYKAFDRLPATPINVGGATLNVAFAPGEFALPRNALIAWLEQSAKAVSVYYGRFPVASVRLLVVPAPGSGVQKGTSFGYRGAAIRLIIGSDATGGELRKDWVVVHEMTHLALPDVPDPHLWLAEGLATYVEPIARVQAGDLTEEKIWGDMVRDMPKGLPDKGDRGLDHTPTWGRTYWGGAMFCLLADVEIRKQTGNRVGLQQALRGIVEAGGNMEQVWPIERIFKVGDEATGTMVLADLYDKMRAQPYAPDLDALWRELGIVVRGGGGRVTFDGGAPLAPIRQAIVAKPSAAVN
jgi:hypothetical protein